MKPNSQIKYKNGDPVVSLGDVWVAAGSRGVISGVDGDDALTVAVTWRTLVPNERNYKTPVQLFHSKTAIAPDLDTNNPNLAFKLRNR